MFLNQESLSSKSFIYDVYGSFYIYYSILIDLFIEKEFL